MLETVLAMRFVREMLSFPVDVASVADFDLYERLVVIVLMDILFSWGMLSFYDTGILVLSADSVFIA